MVLDSTYKCFVGWVATSVVKKHKRKHEKPRANLTVQSKCSAHNSRKNCDLGGFVQFASLWGDILQLKPHPSHLLLQVGSWGERERGTCVVGSGGGRRVAGSWSFVGVNSYI